MTDPVTTLPDGVRLEFDPDLPIAAHADELADLIAANQVIVVAGATGSGKTTQLPKICLRLGRRRIAHTQPRRIAARTVAERIADEMAVEIGDLVGYQVRFTRRASRQTRLKVMTDGVLLAEIGHDRDLRAYDTIIIDEAHERSLNIDFLLGYLKQLLPRRPELKVIVTSATIDTARFSAHFNDAPVIEVSGRTYPVDVRYAPLAEEDASDLMDGITSAVQALVAEGPGDILCFLSGEREIRDAAEAVTGLGLPNTEVVPLFARLSAAEQHRVFQRHTARRVVLATNVAETSLTVPGIRYVVDPGTARISRYSARTKVQRLPIEAISQASANQRAGRCGREAPGICIRLYSGDDFASRPEFTEPEILRTNLASVILQMAQAGLGDISAFPFVEPPDGGQVTDGMRLLDELGALKPGHARTPRLTPVGHKLARLPVDPRLGRMLVAAEALGCLREVQVIVAALAIPDVRERPADHREQADAMHRRFWTDAPATGPASPTVDAKGQPLRHTVHTGTRPEQVEAGVGGDVIAIWRLWEHLRTSRHDLSGNAFRRMCRSEFLNFLRVREWEDLHAQLRDICRELGMERNSTQAPTDAVLTAVLAGLLSHVGLADLRETQAAVAGKPGVKRRRPGPREYLGARGARFAINPGSALARTPPPLVMAVELVETTRLWARTVAEIKAEWVEQVGGHLLKRSFSEPHWSTSSGSVIAFEKVQLYGVPIIADRLVNYARIDPVIAREIFIRSALVEGAWQTRHEFFANNASVRRLAEDLEERSRRRDIVVDDEVIFDFYDKRIPDEVVSTSHFDAWWRRTSDKHLLDLTVDDLVSPEGESVSARDFPDHWRVGTQDLAVRYVFDPGAGHDGVSVRIPLPVLNQVAPEPFTWQVPGLRQELATELIRGLPKSVRTNFVPAPNFARDALAWLASDGEDRAIAFCLELGRALRALTGVTIDPVAWQPDAVPAHLRVTFVITEGGAETRRSRDFSELRVELATRVSQTLTRASEGNAVTGATSWVFGDVADTLNLDRGPLKVVGYPSLVDEQTTVGLRVLDSRERQLRSHANGVRRLLVLTNPDPTRWVVSHLTNADKLVLPAGPYPTVPALLADARLKAVDRLARGFAGDLSAIRTQAQYEALAVQVRQMSADVMQQVVRTVGEVLRHDIDLRGDLAAFPASATRSDIEAQRENLVFDRFISATSDPWFAHLPRYLKAMRQRLAHAALNPTRDAQSLVVVDELEAEYAELCAAQPPGPLPSTVEEIGFLIEELRVQLFAQQLGTSVTVSPKRIRKAIDEAR